jgi:hypothetical protein
MGLAAAAIALRNIADVGEKRTRGKLSNEKDKNGLVHVLSNNIYLIFKSLTRLPPWSKMRVKYSARSSIRCLQCPASVHVSSSSLQVSWPTTTRSSSTGHVNAHRHTTSSSVSSFSPSGALFRSAGHSSSMFWPTGHFPISESSSASSS